MLEATLPSISLMLQYDARVGPLIHQQQIISPSSIIRARQSTAVLLQVFVFGCAAMMQYIEKC